MAVVHEREIEVRRIISQWSDLISMMGVGDLDGRWWDFEVGWECD